MDKKPKIIIVGAGISGCMATLAAISKGVHVSIFTLMPPCRSPSSAIREGFNAALSTVGENDSPQLHAADTMAHGDGLADPKTVERMCLDAPALVKFFDRMGVLFDRAADGLIALYKSQGSTHARTARAGGATGHAILSAIDGQMRRLALEEKIRMFEGWEFLSPVIDDKGACRGIVAQNLRNSEIKLFSSDAVIVCSGGMLRYAAPSFAHGALLANPDFTTGGLWVDENHATNIAGLFAAGGAAYQYHGRQALPGNEILAKAHGGMVAGKEAASHALNRHHLGSAPQSLLDAAKAREEDSLAKLFAQTGEENAHVIARELSEIHADISSVSKNKVIKLKERLANARPLDASQWENVEIPFMRELSRKLMLAEARIAALVERGQTKRNIALKWTNDGPKIEKLG